MIETSEPRPEGFGPSSPMRNYNGLLNMLERYGKFAAETAGVIRAADDATARLTGGQPHSYVDALPSFDGLLRDVDSAPLYAFTDSAANRCRSLANAGTIDSFVLPTLPSAGVCLADSVSAVYLRSYDIAEDRELRERLSSNGLVPVAGFSSVTCLRQDIQEGAMVPGVRAGELTVLSAMTAAMVEDRVTHKRKFALLHLMNITRLPNDAAAFSALLSSRQDVDGLRGLLDNNGRVKRTANVSRDALSETMGEALKHPQSAIEQLHYVDMPTHYVVSERAARVQEDREPSKKRVARYDDREHWILLDPEEVKSRMIARTDSAGGTHAAPLPHLRRAHDRALRSERYTFKRGEIVRVRPTWVGDREWANGKMCYKVISRLGSTDRQA